MKKHSEKVKNKAILLYSNGLSLSKVANELNIPKSTVTNWIREKNIMRKIKPQADNILMNKAKELYLKGYNSKEISKILNRDDTSIIQWLRKLDVKINHKGPKSKINNENFFDSIDSEEKAYYLGWIMADGNVSINNGQYCLKLHISYFDKELIDSFLKAIDSSNKTKYKPNTGNGSYYVSLTSVHMVKTLMKLGVRPQKSGNEIIPDIPEELMHHFIRGYFDGDGITDIKRKRSGFIAPMIVLKNINLLLNINKNNLIRRHRCKIEMYYMLYGKKDSRILYNYMYKNCNIFLKRKFDRMNIICNNTEVID